jgi:predicted RNase H-like HicB family nuclease
MIPRYSMVIQWSEDDQVFIVTLPEFDYAKTHGETYERAIKQAKELIESFVMWHEQDGKPLPPPKLFDYDEMSPNRSDNERLLATSEG